MWNRLPLRKSNLLLLACAALAACQAGGDANVPCALVHITDLPLTERDNAFYTTIGINGQIIPVLFDTGGTDNLLTESAARRAGMNVVVTGYNYAVGIGGKVMTGTAMSHDVTLGKAHGAKLTFTTLPDEPRHFDADGVLGMDLLYDFDIDLDVSDKRVGLYKTIGACTTPVTALDPPFYTVDLNEARPEHDMPRDDTDVTSISPAVTVSINGARLRAVIDTGAPHTVIFRDTARLANLLEGDVLQAGTITGVGTRNVHADLRLSAPVVIGDLTVMNMPVVVADQRHPSGVDMLLGYDFVTRTHLWIARAAKMLIMQYPPRATPAAKE